MGRRGTILTLVAAMLLVPVSPARAAASFRILQRISAQPNDNGWYARPVTASLRVSGRTILDLCSSSSSTVYPHDGGVGSVSGSRYARRVPSSECNTQATFKQGVHTMALYARAGVVTRSAALTLRVDGDAPELTVVDKPSVVVSTASIGGTVSDALAGPDVFTLELRDALGIAAPVTVEASCDGCGIFHGCALRACGWETTWRYEGALPAGLWSLTPVVRDLAGNEARGESFVVLVAA